MKPERDYGLVDILERLLNKGVILNADLIITVAGVPLIGLSLKAALASIETMLDYGMLEAWDRETRDWYKNQLMERRPRLADDEVILYKTFGYIWYSEGLISSWRPGFWYVTNERIFLWRREPDEDLFETYLDRIASVKTGTEIEFGKDREELNLEVEGQVARIRSSDVSAFEDAIRKALSIPGIKQSQSCEIGGKS
jgi:hypothetical protein